MALQRPIPPPRRSKTAKSISMDVGDLEIQSKLNEFSIKEEGSDSKSMQYPKESDEDQSKSQPISSRNDRLSLPASSSSTTIIDDQKNRNIEFEKLIDQRCRINEFSAVENPEYDSRTIPFRSRPGAASNPCYGSSRTSNLIWFQSGVPPEFAPHSKLESPNVDRSTADNGKFREPPSPLAFAPLPEEETILPPPIFIPPLFPIVAPLYPKLPPSPIMPRSSSNDFNYSTAEIGNNGRLESEKLQDFKFENANRNFEHSNLKFEDPISKIGNSSSQFDSSNSQFNSNLVNSTIGNGPTTESLDAASLRSSMASGGSSFREERSFSPNSSLANPIIFDDDEERLRASVGTGTLTLNQPSIDGSISSNASETIIEQRSISNQDENRVSDAQAISTSTILNQTERLRLAPIGANICNAGWLNKLGSKKKETVRRWCVLKNGVFAIYNDDTSDTPLESVSSKSVEMVFVRTAADMSSYDGDATYSFTISFITDCKKLDNWTFAADRQEDLMVWMTLLTKCIVQSEAADLCEAVDRAGPLFLKKGTTADWESGWFVMRGKVLLYAAEGDVCCYEVDIRKVIRIRTVTDANDCCSMISSQVPFAFVVSTEGSALYAQSHDVATSRVWRDAIESTLIERTGQICEQRLTTDDIPIIVEKCISFVAVYGLSIEGIYRHSGTLTKVKVLFEQFMKDPHAMHLRADEYTVHDVTSVLRKYFRQLDEPLVTAALRPRLIEKSGLAEHGSRIMAHKRLLDELPYVNYNTLRKLLRHLKIVSQHADKNMMTTQNLAAIFGPTLFSVDKELVEEGNSSFVSTSQAINIIADMIINYDDLFNVDNAELQKEKKIQDALQRIESHNLTKTPSQLLLSIHVLEKDANVFNMQINNKVTAGDVCLFAVAHKKLTQTADQLALFEVVCNGQLERIASTDEKLLDLISRWSLWPLEERAANYVIVKPDFFKERSETMSASSLLTSCDVQLSETKSFRKCTFQCSKGEVLMYKNSKGTKPLQSWGVDKVFWYFGCESRRQPPTAHCLTFIEKDAIVRRNKSAPFFGRSICFHDESDLSKWLTTVTLSNRPLRANY